MIRITMVIENVKKSINIGVIIPMGMISRVYSTKKIAKLISVKITPAVQADFNRFFDFMILSLMIQKYKSSDVNKNSL